MVQDISIIMDLHWQCLLCILINSTLYFMHMPLAVLCKLIPMFAIYHPDAFSHLPLRKNASLVLYFINNSAGWEGSVLYGGELNKCLMEYSFLQISFKRIAKLSFHVRSTLS